MKLERAANEGPFIKCSNEQRGRFHEHTPLIFSFLPGDFSLPSLTPLAVGRLRERLPDVESYRRFGNVFNCSRC